MARFRLSRLAQGDFEQILVTNAERGVLKQGRYAALLAAALRKVAVDPEGLGTRDRADLMPGIPSFHIRSVRVGGNAKVKRPVHVICYRVMLPGLIEVVRVLHERMDPGRHVR